MGRGQAVKVVTLDILNIFTPSEQVIQILRFTPLQPNRKKIPIKKAKNGSIHQVTLVRWTSLLTGTLFKQLPQAQIRLKLKKFCAHHEANDEMILLSTENGQKSLLVPNRGTF